MGAVVKSGTKNGAGGSGSKTVPRPVSSREEPRSGVESELRVDSAASESQMSFARRWRGGQD